MMTVSRQCGIVLLLLLSSALKSQSQNQLRFENFNTDHGLSQENVTSVFEDSFGFIWIGTEDGLNVFDGYQFKVYRPHSEDSTTICSNRIEEIGEDGGGNLWVGTGDGLARHIREANSFKTYLPDPTDPNSIPSLGITGLFLDSEKRLWIGTTNGLALYQPETDDFQVFQNIVGESGSLLNNSVTGITEDQNGNLWVSVEGGLSKLTDKDTFQNISYDVSGSSIPSPNTTAVHCDRFNRLWLGSFDAGLVMYDISNRNFEQFTVANSGLANDYITDIREDDKGKIWVGADGGLSQYLENRFFASYYSESGNDKSLTSNTVVDIFFDSENRMWVSTRLGGLCVFDKDRYGFDHFVHNPQDPASLSNNKTAGYLEDRNGNVLVATDGSGIDTFNPRSGKFSRFLDAESGLTNNKTLAMAIDKNGNLWIGMWAGGINVYNFETGEIRKYLNNPSDPNSLSGNHILEVFSDRAGEIWIGTWRNGICKYNFDTDDFTNYKNDPNDPNSLGNGSISEIIEDQEGNIWVPTSGDGISVLNTNTGRITRYTADDSDLGLNDNSLVSIYQDTQNRIWTGSLAGGLNMLDLEAGKSTHYNMENGLPNNVVNGILEDHQNNIWLSTNFGLCRLNPTTGEIKTYDKRDGLQGNQFMPRNNLLLSNGKMLFGGNNGFNMFDPSDLSENQVEPRVYISDIKLFNKPIAIGEKEILKKNVLLTDRIDLEYNQNFLSFEYLGINLRDPAKNQYEYIMEGLQEDWIKAGNDRKVQFMNISPGSYTLKVKASNNDGLWSSQLAELSIVIHPPVWNTWWFRGILLILFASVVFLFNRWRMQKIKHDKLILEEKIKEATDKVKGQNEELQSQSLNLNQAIEETQYVVTEAVESGNFSERIDTRSKTGAWKDLGDSINQLFETIIIPFNEINKIVNHLASGDLTQRFDSSSKGEIEQLAKNLNAAMENLSDLLQDVGKSIDIIGDSSEDMFITSQEMNFSTNEIASAISEMSTGAAEQVTKVDESSNLIEDILRSSQEMGEQAESINETAKTGVTKSEAGMESINKLDEGMKDIMDSSEETTQAISELTHRSKEISAVIRIIKDIASQTNLLALNAAIEAAQAGDAGRGFAVVAEEIRKLAEDSKKSAGDIETLINGVQKYTSATAERISQMNKNIKEGEEATQYSLEAFREIAGHYSETLEKSKLIVTATKNQKDGVTDVVKIINNVVIIAEETAAGTEEIASSSSELSAGMSNFTERTKVVSGIVQELKEKMTRFKMMQHGAEDPEAKLQDSADESIKPINSAPEGPKDNSAHQEVSPDLSIDSDDEKKGESPTEDSNIVQIEYLNTEIEEGKKEIEEWPEKPQLSDGEEMEPADAE